MTLKAPLNIPDIIFSLIQIHCGKSIISPELHAVDQKIDSKIALQAEGFIFQVQLKFIDLVVVAYLLSNSIHLV